MVTNLIKILIKIKNKKKNKTKLIKTNALMVNTDVCALYPSKLHVDHTMTFPVNFLLYKEPINYSFNVLCIYIFLLVNNNKLKAQGAQPMYTRSILQKPTQEVYFKSPHRQAFN
jgi:hypothetical protein